ncbi:MAG TPA: TonB family protein [Steroidobacteraceae bacterium]
MLIVLMACGAVRADQAGKLPRILLSSSIYYPDSALSGSLEGKVLVEFDLQGDGKANHVSIVSADHHVFASAVRQFMKSLRFDMSQPGAAASAGARQRLGFVFCIPPSSLEDTFGLPTPAVFVMHNRREGWKVANPPTADSKGPCLKELPTPELPPGLRGR